MSNSLGDILSEKNFDEPAEVRDIKKFVSAKFGQTPAVKITDNSILISVSNSSLAGALRPELYKLQQQIDTKKRLVIRIG